MLNATRESRVSPQGSREGRGAGYRPDIDGLRAVAVPVVVRVPVPYVLVPVAPYALVVSVP